MKKLLLFFSLLTCLLQAHSQPGSLDPSFAGKGWTLSTIAERSTDVLTLKEGSIIVVLEINRSSTVLARYLPNGTLDNSFGTNGYSEASHMWNASAVLQSDGKIVVLGRFLDVDNNYWFSVARYHPDGSFDNSFDGDGKLLLNLGEGEFPTSIAIQNDGKILVAGGVSGFDFVIARLNPDGSLDNTFDGDGKVFTVFNSGGGRANAIALQSDGKIILAGQTRNSSTGSYDFAVARYHPNGSLDNTFDEDGKVTTDFGYTDLAFSVTLQNDGKIIASGSADNPHPVTDDVDNDFALARYHPDGSLDNTFDEDGKVTTDLYDSETATSVVLHNNKIIVSGTSYDDDDDSSDLGLARYNLDGSLDITFDGDGKVTTSITIYDYGIASALFNDRLYVVGYTEDDFDDIYKGVIAAYQLGSDEEICGNKIDDNGDGQIDEGCPGLPFLTINDITVSESRRRAVVTVSLSKKTDQKVFVDYFTRGGTARIKAFKEEGKDYEANSGTLSISVGKQSVSFVLKITNDEVWEKDEYFKVQLHNAVNATIRKAQGTVTILNDDYQPVSQEVTGITAKEYPEKERSLARLSVTVQPNPSTNYFTLALQGSSNNTVLIRVTDAAGRLIETKAGLAANTTQQIGQNYRPGVYYAEIVQGKERVVVKLLKQSK